MDRASARRASNLLSQRDNPKYGPQQARRAARRLRELHRKPISSESIVSRPPVTKCEWCKQPKSNPLGLCSGCGRFPRTS